MDGAHRLLSNGRATLLLAPVVLLTLQGCATTAPKDYLAAADDTCGAERAQLKSVEDYYNQSIVTGTVIGAVGGAAAGALMGYMIGGKASSAAIGAGAGAVAGGVGGYFVARQKAAADRTALVQTVYSDVNKENTEIDRTTAAFLAVKDCRVRTAETIRADYEAGLISRSEAEQRLARARELLDQDIAFADTLGSKMTERGQEFSNASAKLMESDPNAQTTLAQRNAEMEPAEPSDTAPAAKKKSTKPTTTAAKPRKVSGPPPQDTAGVAQLTESNQVKQQEFAGARQEAKQVAATSFQIEGQGTVRAPLRVAGATT